MFIVPFLIPIVLFVWEKPRAYPRGRHDAQHNSTQRNDIQYNNK
jgi:hypothetical protein